MSEGDLILIRETKNGKQEVVYYINKANTEERIKEKIDMVTKKYPKDLILVTELKQIRSSW